MKNLFFKKGDTNWLGVVLVSALIGALTSWVIIFVSDSVLEISAPDSPNVKGSNSYSDSRFPTNDSSYNNGVCGLRITGRQPSDSVIKQCRSAGGEILCGTVETDYNDRPGSSDNFCDCVCLQQ